MKFKYCKKCASMMGFKNGKCTMLKGTEATICRPEENSKPATLQKSQQPLMIGYTRIKGQHSD